MDFNCHAFFVALKDDSIFLSWKSKIDHMFFFQIKTKRKLFFVRFQIIVLLNLCYRSYKRIISFFVWTHSLNWHHFSYFPIIALTEEKYECLGTWTMQRLNGYEFKHQHHFQSFSTFHHLTEHNQDIFLFHHKYEICFSHYDFFGFYNICLLLNKLGWVW